MAHQLAKCRTDRPFCAGQRPSSWHAGAIGSRPLIGARATRSIIHPRPKRTVVFRGNKAWQLS
jgi:hypothetical protein